MAEPSVDHRHLLGGPAPGDSSGDDAGLRADRERVSSRRPPFRAYLGIDLGLSGAAAMIRPDGLIRILDTPSRPSPRSGAWKGSRRRVYAWEQVRDGLRELVGWAACPVVAILEDVHTMPHDGRRSAQTFGIGIGLWIGLLTAFEIEWVAVPPQQWRRVSGLMSAKKSTYVERKAASVAAARAMFQIPELQGTPSRVHNRAEALLLAWYGSRSLRASEGLLRAELAPTPLASHSALPSVPERFIKIFEGHLVSCERRYRPGAPVCGAPLILDDEAYRTTARAIQNWPSERLGPTPRSLYQLIARCTEGHQEVWNAEPPPPVPSP